MQGRTCAEQSTESNGQAAFFVASGLCESWPAARLAGL